MKSFISRRILCVLVTFFALGTLHVADDPRLDAVVGDFTLGDFLGKQHSLSDFDGSIVVITFLGTECPLAKIYGAQIDVLSEQYKDRGVVFLGINSNQQDTPTEMGHYARQHKIAFPLLKDPGNRVAEFKPDRPARSIHVAGTFNDWSNNSHQMSDPDGDGLYSAQAIVDPGEYRYKMVIDGQHWTHDPASRSLTGYLHESYFVAGESESEQ